MITPAASKNLRDFGQYQKGLSLLFFAQSALFYVFARITDKDAMPASVYGEFATQYPAEWWAAGIMVACAVYILGVEINGAWRWSPGLRLIGAVMQIGILGTFSFSAFNSGGADFLIVFNMCVVAVYVWFAFLNIADLWRAFQKWEHYIGMVR